MKLLNTEYASLVKCFSRQDAYLELIHHWPAKMVAFWEYGRLGLPMVPTRSIPYASSSLVHKEQQTAKHRLEARNAHDVAERLAELLFHLKYTAVSEVYLKLT